MFNLDAELTKNNYIIGQLQICNVVLMNNAHVPWFILVPSVSAVTELYELSETQQQTVLRGINKMSLFVKQHFDVSKLNIAAMGNIVKQLHIHVVGRREDDFAWPGVVWGHPKTKAYSAEQAKQIETWFRNYIDLPN